MNAKEAIEVMQKTYEWLCNIHDGSRCAHVLLSAKPEGTSFTLCSCALNTLEQCVNTCEAISQIGQFNQYSLEQAIELARVATEGR